MKHSLLILSVFLLLFVGNVEVTCAQRASIFEITILSSEGKPQPDIYAYYETGENERKYFKSDSYGIMIVTPNPAQSGTTIKIDAEKSNGYHDAIFNLRNKKQKDTLTYNTRMDIERMFDGKVYQSVDCDEKPEFPGGLKELRKFVAKNINYPPIQGHYQVRMVVQCVIDKDGSVKDAIIIYPGDAINNDYYVREAVHVVSSMPKWKPAKVEGKHVVCLYTIPVMFRLQ